MRCISLRRVLGDVSCTPQSLMSAKSLLTSTLGAELLLVRLSNSQIAATNEVVLPAKAAINALRISGLVNLYLQITTSNLANGFGHLSELMQMMHLKSLATAFVPRGTSVTSRSFRKET